VVIIPITFKADDPEAVMNYCHKLADDLRLIPYHGRSIEVEIDDRDLRGGDKVWSWIKKGIPIRLEVGPRDVASDSVFMARRDRPHKEKAGVPRAEFAANVTTILDEIQDALYERACAFRDEHTRQIDGKDEFCEFFTAPDSGGGPTPIHGGFALTHWSGDPAVEATINDDLGVTIRCVPIEGDDEPGTCPFSGQPSAQRVLFAKSY